MRKIKSYFWYNKRQRNGILFLIGLILIVQFLYFFVEFDTNENLFEYNEVDLIQRRIDSLKVIVVTSQKPTIFPFNPNFISDFKGYQLGMNITEIDNLLAFRKTGKFVNSSKEFQDVTNISDSLLRVISPYFKFPKWVESNNQNTYSNNKINQNGSTLIVAKKDLNSATTEELQSVYGVGEKLAKRIISYRNLLQGFTYDEQLFEVYYLDIEIAQKVLKQFGVQEKPLINKLNLNKATFKEILHLPYIDYALTQRIFNYKSEINKIENLEELKKIDSFPLEKFDRIALYLTLE